MKKQAAVFLSFVIIILFFCSNTEIGIMTNKIYTKEIDLAQDNNEIVIDDTRIMEKSKEIINDIYGVEDFSGYRILSDFADKDIFYIYFLDNDEDGYFISFKIDEGIITTLAQLNDDKPESINGYKSLDELEAVVMDDLKKLRVDDMEDYDISEYNYFNNFLEVKLINRLSKNKITTIVDVYSGELIDYSFFAAYD